MSKQSKSSSKCPPGFVDFEILGGVEGSCLCVTGDATVGSFRIAGPKPWGGASVTKTYRVNLNELMGELAIIKKQQGAQS